jgi:oxygen-independent coproporphyrinogen-3 oxidase
VTRISLGVQSFVDRTLEGLGRIHNAEQAGEAVRLLREAGCRNLSVDLLFALPVTRPGDLEINLKALRELHPDHVSWYSLEFEPGTAFTDMRDSGYLREPEQEETAEEYAAIRSGLSALGYHQYELFSFTRPGHECHHNLKYWRGGEYHGCGPSAHSHIDGVRWQNAPDLAAYLRQETVSGPGEYLTPEAKARELLMTSLRLTEGVTESWFENKTGYRFSFLLGDLIRVWTQSGWIQLEDGRLRLTPDAYLISDQLFREFV